MKMDRRVNLAALDVERFSKQGTEDLQRGLLENSLEAFKQAYKCSRELSDGPTERACAFNLGAAFIAAGQAKRGIDTLQHAIPPDNIREGRSNGDLYFNIGLGYESLGNTEEAVRNFSLAYEEYKFEKNNLEMEAECLEKIGNVYLKKKNIFALDTFSKLADVYHLMGKPVKQVEALAQKAAQMHANGRVEEAEATADECLKISKDCGSSQEIGTVLNDLGLVYTQMQKYDRAVTCFEQALPMIMNVPGDRKQEAVVLQNLGATYNFLGDYQRAINLHERAIESYAQLKNRNSQGQCFANLAFAFSQLGDIESTKESFLHAHQAAKDTGDKRTQWQVCEGLGALAFNTRNIPRAIEYFKKALSIISAADSNTVAQDRIVSKLTHALQVQVQGVPPKAFPVNPSMAMPFFSKAKESAAAKFDKMEEEANLKEEADGETKKRKRFVPVNRPGSTRQFYKVARGLSSGTLPSLQEGMMSLDSNILFENQGLDPESDSDSSSSSSSSSSDSQEDQKVKSKVTATVQKKKQVFKSPLARLNASKRSNQKQVSRPQYGTLLDQEEESSDSDSSTSEEEEEVKNKANDQKDGKREEDDEDMNAVKQHMRMLNKDDNSDSDDSSDDSDSTTKATSGNEAPPQQPQEEPRRMINCLIDDFDLSEEEDTSDEDDEDGAPNLPTQSPVPTTQIVNTYETPQSDKPELARQKSYKDLDFDNTTKSGEKRAQRIRRESNYMSGDSDEDGSEFSVGKRSGPYENVTTLRTHSATSVNEKSDTQKTDTMQFDPTYQSIDFQRTENDSADVPSFEKFTDLPRGEKERFLHEQHQLMRQKEIDNKPDPPAKDSKTCVVM